MLKDAKQQCDKLIVGLQTDPTLDRPEKNKPIQSYGERYIQLEAVKYVDEIIKYKTEEELYQLLKLMRPNIRILGSDYQDGRYSGAGQTGLQLSGIIQPGASHDGPARSPQSAWQGR